MPADAFTVLGAPEEKMRVCLGGSLPRERLPETLRHLSNALSTQMFMG